MTMKLHLSDPERITKRCQELHSISLPFFFTQVKENITTSQNYIHRVLHFVMVCLFPESRDRLQSLMVVVVIVDGCHPLPFDFHLKFKNTNVTRSERAKREEE